MTALAAPLATPTTSERILLALSRVLADHAHARMHARATRADVRSQRDAAVAAGQRLDFQAEAYLRAR
ncbi:hypothetical protein [Microbacterium sp. RURRCA19A]|uniref:hypothetical protein n=1 Tax=Microbacterium sp. RURRCA19A TaxID=1907391 RepID=UPI0009568286|nr:hypothetical protein [Microbacterium sp. RURRCA19A]SIR52356.1 hypothetical protein SAMN05880568_0305 [Microbacterium sp. RURRCA19A]